MAEPKFKIGQVVMYDRGTKRDIPLKILDSIERDGVWFYGIDRDNFLSESMVRALTDEEKGDDPERQLLTDADATAIEIAGDLEGVKRT